MGYLLNETKHQPHVRVRVLVRVRIGVRVRVWYVSGFVCRVFGFVSGSCLSIRIE